MNIYDNPKSRVIWFSLGNHGRKWKGDEILPPWEKSPSYKRRMANQFRAFVVYYPSFPSFIGVPCWVSLGGVLTRSTRPGWLFPFLSGQDSSGPALGFIGFPPFLFFVFKEG
jgi:hypothetical protein